MLHVGPHVMDPTGPLCMPQPEEELAVVADKLEGGTPMHGLTLTLAPLCCVVVVTCRDATAFSTDTLYEVIIVAKVGDSTPVLTVSPASAAFEEAARLTTTE